LFFTDDEPEEDLPLLLQLPLLPCTTVTMTGAMMDESPDDSRQDLARGVLSATFAKSSIKVV
jgi:hypothetical protein